MGSQLHFSQFDQVLGTECASGTKPTLSAQLLMLGKFLESIGRGQYKYVE